MPECAEVHTFVSQLNKEFGGKKLNSLNIIGGRFIKENIINLNKISFPLHNVKFNCQGKFIYWSFDEDVFVFNTLGMTGSFGKKNKHSAIKFTFDDNEIYFNDIRRFGNFKFILSKQELNEKLNSLGWDPLNDLNTPYWLLVKIRKNNNKTIAEVLMNQSIFAGCGNYLKNEILYAVKIHPNKIVSQLTDEQLILIAEKYKLIVNEAYKHGGATLATYNDLYGIAGSFWKQFKVYSKKYDPDGNTVLKIKTKDGRTSYYVNNLQKL